MDGTGSALDNAIETEVMTVAAKTTTGGAGTGINLLEASVVAVDTVASFSVNRVALDASTGTAATTTAGLSDLVTAGNGNIVLETLAGTITLNEGTGGIANAAVSANGSGNVRVEAQDPGTDVLVNAQILSGTGNLTLRGGRNVTFAGTGNVIVGANPGTIDVQAVTGTVDQGATLTLQTDQANILVVAAVDAKLGVLDARKNTDRTGGVLTNQASWGNVGVTATGGSILDNKARAGTAENLWAKTTRLEAKTNLGQIGRAHV